MLIKQSVWRLTVSERESKEISRRDFLAASLGAALLAVAGCGSEGNGESGDNSNTAGNSGAGTGGTVGASSQALVGLVRDTDFSKAVRDAVNLVGGLPDLNGKTVLLKPNLNSNEGPPTSPNPEVVRAAIRMVKARGAIRVIVGDRSNPSYDTIQAMTAAGIYDVAITEGAEPMNFSGQATRRLTTTFF